ncbi:MAG: hypothetical protein CYG60_23450 [Actinobacteria bacterium]|nr:MAG: hypothetical protein CYG60_23450 [Actinomycetota bacterium]
MAPRKIDPQEFAKWFSVKDAANNLGRSRQGIRNMLVNGELRGVHTRIGWLIDPASVRAFRLLRQDDAEREKIARRDALIREAHQTHEVRP